MCTRRLARIGCYVRIILQALLSNYGDLVALNSGTFRHDNGSTTFADL